MADDDPMENTQLVDVSDSFEEGEVESLVGRTVAGKYEITRRIARGGMGVVYLAEHATLGRTVVFKVLSYHLAGDRNAKSRFEREARGLSVLDHPNIVTVHDFGYEKGLTYIVMEYVHGENLSQRVRREGRIRYDELLPIMLQTIDAIAEAHEKKIVHRDIKPSNVMTTQRAGRDDFVKVLDFGLAKLAYSSVDLTKGNLIGTVSYLAPEVIRGGEATPASDVYSLGVMFYYLLSGEKPFQAADEMSVLYQHVNEEPVPLRDRVPAGEAPDVFLEFIHRCMSKDPEKRPTNASEMRFVLGELVSLPRISAFSLDSSTAIPRMEFDSSADQSRPIRQTPGPAREPDDADASRPSIAKARPNRWARIGVIAFTTFSIGAALIVALRSGGEESPANAPAAPSDTATTRTPATFSLQATPPGEVQIDGEPGGEAPVELELEPGTHEVTVAAEGYQAWSQSISLEAGERRRVDVFLTKAGAERESRAETTVTPRPAIQRPDEEEALPARSPDAVTVPDESGAEDAGRVPDAGTADAATDEAVESVSERPDEEEQKKGLLSVDEKQGGLLPVE